jgi:hypothetical protein
MNLVADDIVIAVVFAIAGWMLKMYLTHREKMRALSMSKQGVEASDQRLERVEQAVESIAIEIERVSEGQRFVTKLLSERAQLKPDVLPVLPRRVDTPH